MKGVLPSSTVQLIGDGLHQLAVASSQSLGLGRIISIAIALWSGVRGMRGIMQLNISYDQPERRSCIRLSATARRG